jgi:hypothetical protein
VAQLDRIEAESPAQPEYTAIHDAILAAPTAPSWTGSCSSNWAPKHCAARTHRPR